MVPSLCKHVVVFLLTLVISRSFVYTHILERKQDTERRIFHVNRTEQSHDPSLV